MLPGQPSGKFRPALVLSVNPKGTATVVAIKITGSAPTPRFPFRVPIVDYTSAELSKVSYAEIDSEILIRITGTSIYRGTLNPSDFNNVLRTYISYQRSVRRRPTR
ncbi:type II toxin-antitoxin system PemK/MazF family toxin [Robertmurraya sp. GLU-23]